MRIPHIYTTLNKDASYTYKKNEKLIYLLIKQTTTTEKLRPHTEVTKVDKREKQHRKIQK